MVTKKNNERDSLIGDLFTIWADTVDKAGRGLFDTIKNRLAYKPQPLPDLDEYNTQEELKVLRDHIQKEIAILEKDEEVFREGLHEAERRENSVPGWAELVPDITHRNKQLRDYRNFLLDVNVKLERTQKKAAPHPKPSQDQEDEEIRRKIKMYKEKMKQEEAEAEDEEDKQEVRVYYGRKIDRLREKLD